MAQSMWGLTSRSDINYLNLGAKAACLQPGFHLPFVQFGKFPSADFLLKLFTAFITEFRRHAKGSIGKLTLTGAHELQISTVVRTEMFASLSAMIPHVAGFQGHPTSIFGKYLFGRRFDI